ncbi:hypothetical protein [Neomegalonema sp.]|uniref:hypothetical protein n=1 Tax=Neomegalonema sp. TaxID=2039713 RepID=UPI00262D52F1|nr:hypothetical protein [Neomegalonema sp.]MDD2868194.1 hypothetical protein [Neomegalonema sp.]
MTRPPSRPGTGEFRASLLAEAGFVALTGLVLSPLILLDLADEDSFALLVLGGYVVLNALRRIGEPAKLPEGLLRRFGPRLAGPPAAAEPESLRRLAATEARLTRARARLRRREDAAPELQESLAGLAQEYRAVRRAVLEGAPGAEAQATRLRRLAESLGDLAQAAAASPDSGRGRQAAEALREALERLSAQRVSLSEMADEAGFEASLQTLRERLPPEPPARALPENEQAEPRGPA